MEYKWEFERANPQESFPPPVLEWLSDCYLLHNVPFRYLVADESMLPPESARFFQVDLAWINALCDGALSIGRQTQTDNMLDGLVLSNARRAAHSGIPGRRERLMHENHKRRGNESAAAPDTPMSGFLLRSVLVRHWKGVQVIGHAGQDLCKLVRMDALSDSVMLCIFAGIVDRVQIIEPTEELHFGSKGGEISVRAVAGEVGLDTGKTVTLPVSNRRVDVRELAARAAKELGIPKLDSAQLALQMICVADQCELKSEVKK